MIYKSILTILSQLLRGHLSFRTFRVAKQHFNTSKQPIKQVSFRAFRVACHPSFGSRVMEEIPVDLEPYDVQAARVEEQWEVR